MQQLSRAGALEIQQSEGVVLKYYLDPVKIPTIGIGFTWRSSSFRKWWTTNKKIPFGPGATMTREECTEALMYLCNEEYGKAVANFLGKTVPQHVFDAMTSVVYNVGAKALGWSWAAAAKTGDYATSAMRLRVTATTAEGVELRGLKIRRAEEARLLEKGIYSESPTMPTPAESVLDLAINDGILVRGERGPSVKTLQKLLEKAGYTPGLADGLFGNGTYAAVVEFQRANKLAVDGIAGRQTLQKVGFYE